MDMTSNAIIPFTQEELADMLFLRTGKNPIKVRTQGLLVIGHFASHPDHQIVEQIGVWRIEDLIVGTAMTLRWSPKRYLEAEERLADA